LFHVSGFAIFGVVELKQIEDEALGLPESLRAGLALPLLQSLPASGLDVSDEEVLLRDQELENGSVEALSHDEFVRRVEATRGR
jgi:hypothetical protein